MFRGNRNPLPSIGISATSSWVGGSTSGGSRVADTNCANEFSQASLDIGISSKQGKRPYQEDEFACKAVLSSRNRGTASVETHFLGLFDGHAGGRCSKYLSTDMSQALADDPLFDTNLPQALKRSFHTVNENFLKVADKLRLQDGSTGICVILREEKYVVANVGDCRAVLISEGRPIQLSKDQKPTSPEEQKRIYALGGTVVNCMGIVRVNGVLAVARAFGNRSLRDVIRPDAEITQRAMGLGDEFLVLASDGLWDVLTNQAVCDICQRMSGHPAATISEELVNSAITRGSMDNVTCIVLKLDKFVSRELDVNAATASGSRSRTVSNASESKQEHMTPSIASRYTQSPSPSLEKMAPIANGQNLDMPPLRPMTTSTGDRFKNGIGNQSNPNPNPSWKSLSSASEDPLAPSSTYWQQPYGQHIPSNLLKSQTGAAGGALEPSNRYLAAYTSYHRDKERSDTIKLTREGLDGKSLMSINSTVLMSSQNRSSLSHGNGLTGGSLGNTGFRSISGDSITSGEGLTLPSSRLLHSPITTRAKGTKYTERASTANSISRRVAIKREI